jgi:hypothetical protein
MSACSDEFGADTHEDGSLAMFNLQNYKLNLQVNFFECFQSNSFKIRRLAWHFMCSRASDAELQRDSTSQKQTAESRDKCIYY